MKIIIKKIKIPHLELASYKILSNFSAIDH